MSSLATRIPPLRVGAISHNFLRKIVLQRHLIWNFVVRDLKSRYVGSFMGFFWSVIHPLVLLLSYSFVFSVIFRVERNLRGTDSFPLFLFCGILPWLYFQETVVRSCHSVVEQGNLIRKTLFPSEILPVTVVIANLITHLIGFAMLFLLLLFEGTIGWAALALPVFFVLLMVLSLGLGWLVAALQVFLRDTAQILAVLMVAWFWFTPVFYQVDMVPDGLRPWIRVNPMTHVVESYRSILLENQLPDLRSFLTLAALAFLAFVVGGFVFRNTKKEFIDVL